MTVLDFLHLARANFLLLIAGLLVGVIGGMGVAMMTPKTFTSTSTGYVNVDESTANAGEVIAGNRPAQERAAAYVPLVTSRAVAEEIAERSDGVYTADQVAGRLTANVIPSSALIQVTATGNTPEKARDLANASLEATAAVVGELEGRESPVEVIPLEDAQLPASPASPDTSKYVLAGGLLGLVLAFGVAYIRKVADVKVRSTTDVETAAGAAVLGVLPKDLAFRGGNRATEALQSRAAEAVRQLRTNLRFVSVDAPPRTLLITSARSAEGKSTVSTTLAQALARAGESVLVIDADLRRPTVADVFDLDGSVGLSQILTGQISFQEAVRQVEGAPLFILPAGRIPPDPSELLGSERMRELLRSLRQDFTVIIDAAPLLPVTDASLLAATVDGTVLVVKAGDTRKDHVKVAREMVRKVNGRLLGVVLNQVPTGGITSHYYGYGYGAYESYYTKPSSRKARGGGRSGQLVKSRQNDSTSSTAAEQRLGERAASAVPSSRSATRNR